MKIITILFILFTLVISTEIRDETTFRSVGNEENDYVNITETTKTIEENKEYVSYEEYDDDCCGRQKSHLKWIFIISIFLFSCVFGILALCLDYKEKSNENIKSNTCAIQSIEIICWILASIFMFMIFCSPILYMLYSIEEFLIYIGTILE